MRLQLLRTRNKRISVGKILQIAQKKRKTRTKHEPNAVVQSERNPSPHPASKLLSKDIAGCHKRSKPNSV